MILESYVGTTNTSSSTCRDVFQVTVDINSAENNIKPMFRAVNGMSLVAQTTGHRHLLLTARGAGQNPLTGENPVQVKVSPRRYCHLVRLTGGNYGSSGKTLTLKTYGSAAQTLTLANTADLASTIAALKALMEPLGFLFEDPFNEGYLIISHKLPWALTQAPFGPTAILGWSTTGKAWDCAASLVPADAIASALQEWLN